MLNLYTTALLNEVNGQQRRTIGKINGVFRFLEEEQFWKLLPNGIASVGEFTLELSRPIVLENEDQFSPDWRF